MRVVERASDGTPQGALVFFHGFWGIPEDFVPFMDKVDPARRLHAFLPQAPTHVSEGRYSWEGGEDETSAWLDTLPFPLVRTVLAGWSQGTGLAYRLALRDGRPRPAGVVALGGSLAPDVTVEPPFPAFLVAHGAADESVPVERAREACDRLTSAGAAVEYHETAIGHQIDQDVVPAIRSFLERLP